MSTSIATISWTPAPGSTGTLVEYRVDGTTTWITPNIPTNPTLNATYPLTITDNVVYNVRLTNFAATCLPRQMTFNIVSAVNNCCPSGYSLSPDGTFCMKVNTVAATPPSSQEVTVASTNAAYTDFGSFIYASGYASNGTGSSTQIPTSNNFWWNPSLTTTDGPLNRSGLWATTTTGNQDVGFSVCITVPTTSVYYIGMGVDNYGILQLDGTTIITQDVTALALQYNAQFPGIGAFVTFKIWHIYPVTLTQGTHVLNIIGHNVSGAAGLGVEVYNLTASQIQSATSYADMGSGLIFSSKDFIGQNVQIGSGGAGYTCPSGYSLVFCTPSPFCTQTLTTPIIPCGPTTTTTTTTTHTTTSTTTTTTSSHSTTTTSTTTTTTTTASPTFTLTNSKTGATINNLTPGNYSIPPGSLPMSAPGSASGLHAAGTGISYAVNTSSAIGGSLRIFLNAALQQTIIVSGSTTTFSPLTFSSSDTIAITLT